MKKRFVKRQELKHEMVLQITSMADIFTILLVFLLKTLATGVSSITPSTAIILPQAHNVDPVIDTVKLEVSASGVMLDDSPVTPLDQFRFQIEDLSNEGTSKSLDLAFAQQHQRNTLKEFSSLILLADRGTPFGTLKRILASANGAGFIDYRLVVAEAP